MIKTFWSYVSGLALKPEYDLKQIKRYTRINQYLFIAILIYTINGFTDLFYGYVTDSVIVFSSALLFVLLFFFKKQHHNIVIMLLFVYISLTIFYFGTFAIIQAGDYLYYFPLVLAIGIVFDFKRDKKRMLFLFGFVTLLLLVYALTYNSSREINMEPQSERYRMFIMNLAISAATVGFFIYLTVEDNRASSEMLEQRLKEKEESEAVIRKTLAEKEILLQELHHRVKNNLAVIVSYFNLKLNSTENEDARIVLLESRNHVNSMALIHNRLYKTGNFLNIDFTDYLQDLLKEIRESFPAMLHSVNVSTYIQDVVVDLNTAIPCALILNELLNNCYKHGFNHTKQGVIRIDFYASSPAQLTLSVRDNGMGFKEDFDKYDSMGLSIIKGLSEQLNGRCRFFNDNGACFILEFDRSSGTVNKKQ